ncbi:MAG: pentapeptide repeat-containing protein [Leptolyngbyaceae cyanobacterium SL_7_1]|nr:pentapeptide repeat-containing protein [Leptolyngbyaceae cyanobacterium SL_7_1]
MKFFLLGLLASSIALISPVYAQSDDELRELYDLCSRFPYNSRCEGLEIPVPLDQRSGVEINCSLELDSLSDSDTCKINVTDTGLTVYLETGEPVELLDDRRGTQELVIPFDTVLATRFRLWEQEMDAGSFLIGGTLYVEKDADLEELAADFDPATDLNEENRTGNRDFAELEISFITRAEGEQGNRSNVLKIVSSEEFGAFVTSQIAAARPSSGTAEPAAGLQGERGAIADPVNQLLETRTCVRCDLTGADLSNADLAGVNLEGATLAGANLSGANLEGSYLVGANLENATLTGANLKGARLIAVRLIGADLSEVGLQDTDLQLADLQNANLSRAEVSGANLAQANLANVLLEGADLSDVTTVREFVPFLGIQRYKFFTNLTGANLTGATLTDANFEDVRLYNADLSNALGEVDLSDTRVCGATLPDGSVTTQGCE